MYNSDMPSRADLPTSSQLLRSTLIAIGVAAALLVTVVLPAEYGVDPTRIGRVLGLTEMGEIKQQLAEEAELDAAMTAQPEQQGSIAEPSEQPAEMAEAPAPAQDMTAEESPAETTAVPADGADAWTDETILVLGPGEAAEIKLVMQAGATANFEWTAEPGHLNSALHGDGTAGEAISYRNGRAETSHAGDLVAEFDGSHGWFWRNRSDETVTMTLKTKGDYSEIKRVL